MSRRSILITFPVILLFAIYFLGPEPESPKWEMTLPTVPQESKELESYITSQEGKHKIKEDNEARIIWADSSHRKTEYAVIYLHGFSASQGEGDPVHRQFAKTFGCNLYLARMADHGVDTTEQLLYFTPDRWWASTKEALAIGKAIGDKIIVMSTSTGGTMAMILASSYPEDVHALINMSPNVALRNPAAFMGNNPWGLQIVRMVLGGDYNILPFTPGADSVLEQRYWNLKYRAEAICQLQELLEDKMIRTTFEKIHQPSLSLYYYRDEEHQDPLVSVKAILDMNDKLSTPDSLKRAVALPNAGGHVLGAASVSKDIESVVREVNKFAIENLKMKPVASIDADSVAGIK